MRNDFLPLGGTRVQEKRYYVDLVYSPFCQKFIIHSSSDIGSFDQVEVEVDW